MIAGLLRNGVEMRVELSVKGFYGGGSVWDGHLRVAVTVADAIENVLELR